MKRMLCLLVALVMMLSAASAVAEVKYTCMEDHQTYPISKEKITLRLWYPMAGSMGELANFNDSEFFQWMEELTNIHIEFEIPTTNTEKDAFQLLFASDEMPDLIYSEPGKYQYRGGEDKAIEDGYFINLADYMQYAPNYQEWLETYPAFKKASYSDSGKMYGLWGVWFPMYDIVQADQGLAVRKDFLDKVGLDVPVTYDDWYVMLKAFKDQLGIEAPYYTSKYGIDVKGEMMAGFDTAPYFYQKDGAVKYGPLDDSYKEYLTMLNKWWNEGLLDRDFATRTSTGITADNEMMLNDKVGSLTDYGTRLSDTYITRGATNPEFYLVGVQQPVKKVGDVPAYRDYMSGNDMLDGYCMNINAASKNIEAAIRWTDAFYAASIYLNANFGIDSQENVVWHKAEDGHRIGNYDFRYKNPNGISSATVLVKYWSKNPNVRVESAQIEQSDENKQNGYKTWSQFVPTNWLSIRNTFTSEEGTEYASMYTDIETYVQECNVKFIMGQMSLDDYDSYRDTLRKMGIERCIELKQSALDRYNAR
ncbi:MAG: hypothetical protein RR065_01000 [Clostridia bacterium]